jgi:hypothetical protein
MATSHPVTPASTEVSMDKYNFLGVEGSYLPNSNASYIKHKSSALSSYRTPRTRNGGFACLSKIMTISSG